MNASDARTLILTALEDVAPEIEASDLNPDVSLRDDADLDSMDLLAFFATVAEELAVDIPEDDYPHLETINRAVAYVVSRAP